MPVTLAFDVYGTLIDTHGVVAKLQDVVGSRAGDFSRTWRDRQLEYSFRRGLMRNYEDFSVCTSQALDYTCQYYKISLSTDIKKELLAAYRILPAFKDVHECLSGLQTGDYEVYAFSNGSTEAVDMLLTTAGIRDLFAGIVSVDDLKSFKPNPAVYAHFLRESGASAGCNAWMISANSFDVIGAISAGMRAVWVQRSSDMIFDPWGIEPTITVSTLNDLGRGIAGYYAQNTVR